MATRTLLLLALLAIFAAPVCAQDAVPPTETPPSEPPPSEPSPTEPSPPADSPDEEAAPEAEPPPEYAARILEALEESNNGNWAEARAAFREAHRLFPNARTLRGMGMVAFEIRDYVDCVRHFRSSLANEVRPLTERQQVEVQALLGRALERVAVFTLAEVPEGAVISVDGRVIEREEDGSILLPIGDHALVVEAESRWESSIPVRGGENEVLPMSFSEPEPDRSTGPQFIVAPVAPAAPPPDGSVALTIAGAATAVAGLAVLIAGLVDYFGVQGSTGDQWDSLADAYDRAPILQGVGYAVIGVGAALTIGGIVWMGSGDGGGSAQLRMRVTF